MRDTGTDRRMAAENKTCMKRRLFLCLAATLAVSGCGSDGGGGVGGGGGAAPIPTLPSTVLISVESAGSQSNSDCDEPSVSSDGRYIAFESSADNLVAGDTNQCIDVFVRDRVAGTTVRVSVNSTGTQGNAHSRAPSISSDGRYVAFGSYATNLAPGDTNNHQDVFVRDGVAGSTVRVSVDSSGVQGDSYSFNPSISSDGRHVAFESVATNLAAGDTNALGDVFARDTVAGTTVRVSVDSSGVEGDDQSAHPSISSDGRYVAFESTATNLVAGDMNGFADVFVRDLVAGATVLASIGSTGVQGNLDSFSPSIAPDGRYVVFGSSADNLAAGDTNGNPDIFMRDTFTGTTARVSVDSQGAQSDGQCASASVSSDGRSVAFWSDATNLVAGDTSGDMDIFVRDTVAGTTVRVSVDSSGAQANHYSFSPCISPNGLYVAFGSNASNLVTGDANGQADVFVRGPLR